MVSFDSASEAESFAIDVINDSNLKLEAFDNCDGLWTVSVSTIRAHVGKEEK